MQQSELQALIVEIADKHNDVIRFSSARKLNNAVEKISQGLALSKDRVWDLIQERGFERMCSESSNPERLTDLFLMYMTDQELDRAIENGAQIDIDF